jgi:hypothetical protein
LPLLQLSSLNHAGYQVVAGHAGKQARHVGRALRLSAIVSHCLEPVVTRLQSLPYLPLQNDASAYLPTVQSCAY